MAGLRPGCSRLSSFSLKFRKPMLLALLAVPLAAGAGAEPSRPAPAIASIDFAREIAPLFRDHCFECHGPKKQKSDYRLDRRESAFKGGDSGEAAIVPGRSEESRLIKLVAGLDAELVMPPEGSKRPRLKPDEIARLRAWIDQGAAWSGDSAEPPGRWWSLAARAAAQPPALPQDQRGWAR